MNKLTMVIRRLHHSEGRLASLLLRTSDRHQTDHDVYFLARDLARWSGHHVSALAEAGRYYGLSLADTVDGEPRLLGAAQRRAARLSGRSDAQAMLLLADMRRVYRRVSGVSVDWVVLAQGAQAARDSTLLKLTQQCHPDTLRQLRWANSILKLRAGQALVGR